MQYLNEYHGDATPTIQIINHLRGHVKQSEATAVDTVIKSAEISTSKLIKELEMDASNINFTRFQNFVKENCLLTLDSMYGKFASFTGPIVTINTLCNVRQIQNNITKALSFHKCPSQPCKILQCQAFQAPPGSVGL